MWSMYACLIHALDSHDIVFLHYESNMSLSPSNKALPTSCHYNVADDSPASSTPVKGAPLDVEVPLRRSLSSSRADSEFMNRQWDKEEEGSSDDENHSEDYQLKRAMPLDKLRCKPPREGGQQRNNSSLKKHRRHSSWPENYLADAKFSKQQGKRIKSLSRMDLRKDSDELKSSERCPSHQRNHSKTSSKASASSEECTSSEGACLYSFEASRRGSLGMSVEASRRGTIIHSVREHSPLFGLVEVGDKIVNVDGVDTRGMSTVVVAHLLGRKRGQCTKLRITVSRGPVGTAPVGIRTISMPKRLRRKSFGHIHHSPPEEHCNRSAIDDRESSFPELHISTLTLENEEDERDDAPFPFHFIGAGAHDDEDVDA